MILQISTGLRNVMIEAIKPVLSTCVMKLYSGVIPSNADEPIGTGNILLSTIYNGNDGSTPITFKSAAAGGTLLKNDIESWAGTNANTGTATFYRLENADDSQALSLTDFRVQGDIATSAAALNLTSVALSASAVQSIDYYSISLPE